MIVNSISVAKDLPFLNVSMHALFAFSCLRIACLRRAPLLVFSCLRISCLRIACLLLFLPIEMENSGGSETESADTGHAIGPLRRHGRLEAAAARSRSPAPQRRRNRRLRSRSRSRSRPPAAFPAPVVAAPPVTSKDYVSICLSCVILVSLDTN
jgi:hypothetical protein